MSAGNKFVSCLCCFAYVSHGPSFSFVPVFCYLPSMLYGRVCRGGEGRGVRRGMGRGIDSSFFSRHHLRAEADACRLDDVGAHDGYLQDARRLEHSQTVDYCTSLRRYPPACHTLANPIASWAAAKVQEATASGGCNCGRTNDEYSRRPSFCGRYMVKKFLRQHLSPL